MVYRRTREVMRRLSARRKAILSAARVIASEAGMAGVQIIPVARLAGVAAGTVYRYFPSKADLVTELIEEITNDHLAAMGRAGDAAPGPLSALSASLTTLASAILADRKLAWGILAEPLNVDVTGPRLSSRRALAAEIEGRIEAAVRAGHISAQDSALSAAGVIGAMLESLVGPLAPAGLDDPARRRDAAQTVSLLTLRAVGIVDARARGLVVQSMPPAPPDSAERTLQSA